MDTHWIYRLFFFKLTMVHKAKNVLAEKNNLNEISRLLMQVATSAILFHKLSEYMKLADIAQLKMGKPSLT